MEIGLTCAYLFSSSFRRIINQSGIADLPGAADECHCELLRAQTGVDMVLRMITSTILFAAVVAVIVAAFVALGIMSAVSTDNVAETQARAEAALVNA